MKFGPVATAEAAGAILAHSLRLPAADPGAQQGAGQGEVRRGTLKKGRKLSPADVEAIEAAGYTEVIAAQLEPGDVDEDGAAARLVEAVKGARLRASAPFTGRCNLFAEAEGLLVVDEPRLEQLNFVHEDLTVATLPPMTWVSPRQMVATAKIIPFATSEDNVAACEAIAAAGELLRVAPFTPKAVGYVQTRLPGTKESVLDKSSRVSAERLERLGSAITVEQRCAHDAGEISAAIEAVLASEVQMILVAGASAIVDRRDVVPEGIVAAGGRIEHFGMPVDPGNLLLLARIGEVPVIGLPGCARSPKMSGFDFVLRRLAADLPVGADDIKRMGTFGLLKEHAERPSPRAGQPPADGAMAPARQAKIAALVLAAGQSRRMGTANKLLETVEGKPLVAHAVEVACASSADPVVVVTGHESDRVAQSLAGFDVRFVHNPDYASGLSSSLGRGIAALDAGIEGVLVCLGDMPRVSAAHLDRLIAAFDPVEGRSICVPTVNGKRGNPVLFAEALFAEMKDLRGDVGARQLIGDHDELVCEVEVADPAIFLDVDHPEALAALRQTMSEVPSG